jgi:hypothetical protein
LTCVIHTRGIMETISLTELRPVDLADVPSRVLWSAMAAIIEKEEFASGFVAVLNAVEGPGIDGIRPAAGPAALAVDPRNRKIPEPTSNAIELHELCGRAWMELGAQLKLTLLSLLP